MMSSNSQSIKALRPLKGRIIVHEDFGISSNDDTIQSENKLIHEHDFITTRIKETNSFLIHCITCGICYCDLCGKALGDKVINNHECMLGTPIKNSAISRHASVLGSSNT